MADERKTHARYRFMDEDAVLCRHTSMRNGCVVVLEDTTDSDDLVTCHWCRIRVQANIDHAFRMATMPEEKRKRIEQMRNRNKIERLLQQEVRHA